MNASNKCIDLIKKWEGLKLRAYICPAGVWTIGYGTIRYEDGSPVREGDSVSQERAEELLSKEVEKRSVELTKIVGKLGQNKFDALLSWCYNFSPGRLKKTTLLSRIKNDPNDFRIADEFLKWRNADGKPERGLLLRRIDEAMLYFS
jgi:lysozyme